MKRCKECPSRSAAISKGSEPRRIKSPALDVVLPRRRIAIGTGGEDGGAALEGGWGCIPGGVGECLRIRNEAVVVEIKDTVVAVAPAGVGAGGMAGGGSKIGSLSDLHEDFSSRGQRIFISVESAT